MDTRLSQLQTCVEGQRSKSTQLLSRKQYLWRSKDIEKPGPMVSTVRKKPLNSTSARMSQPSIMQAIPTFQMCDGDRTANGLHNPRNSHGRTLNLSSARLSPPSCLRAGPVLQICIMAMTWSVSTALHPHKGPAINGITSGKIATGICISYLRHVSGADIRDK